MFTLFGTKSIRTPAVTRIYLDYASATPLLPGVKAVMEPFWTSMFGNPSAIHTEGAQAKAALTTARASVASILQIQPSGVTFTSGGTESNNLAILGSVSALRGKGIPYTAMEIITTRIEHPATLRTVEHLSGEGVTVHYVAVDSVGRIMLSELKTLLSAKTVLVSVAYVNSEIGTIEDIGAISRIIKAHIRTNNTKTVLHVDAAQTPLWLPCQLSRLGADLLSLDAGKFGGPKGVGVLAHTKDVTLTPVTYGGGQEAGVRPGTESLVAIVGFTKALELANQNWENNQASVIVLRDYFIAEIKKAIPGVILNGAVDDSRVANNVNISIPGLDSEFAVISLDVAGIACSTKSACSSVGGGESTVVMAISGDMARASSTLRFSLGVSTTKSELDQVVAVLSAHINRNIQN